MTAHDEVQTGLAATLATQTVPAQFLPRLAERLEHQGLPGRRWMSEAGLDLDRLDAPDMRVCRDLVRQTLRQLARHTGRSDIGFEAGLASVLRADSPLLQMLLSAANLRAALEALSGCFVLLSPSYHLGLRDERLGIALEVTPLGPVPYDLGTMSLECILVSLNKLLAVLKPAAASGGCALAVSWAPPPHHARYRELGVHDLRFNAGCSLGFTLTVPGSWLSSPLSLAHDAAFRAARKLCEQQIAQLREQSHWSAWVRSTVAAADAHQMTQHEVASLLRISSRTLSRKLAEEGNSFRDIVQAVRFEKARSLLRDTSFSQADIAHQLGYGNVANFSHAFKQRAGVPPGQYRTMGKGRAHVSSPV